MTETTLWRWFSIYIRLRDSDQYGYCTCFTCGKIDYYKQMDCGHGHGRQHTATKYNEKNNHAQCTTCNWANEGRKDLYAKAVDRRYGVGTWDMLEVLSRKTKKKMSAFDIKVMGTFYRLKAQALMKQKTLAA
jgi:hypothetical protein